MEPWFNRYVVLHLTLCIILYALGMLFERYVVGSPQLDLVLVW